MPQLDYGINAYKRDRGNLPELPLINLFVEQTPTEDTGILLQSRPGLVLETEVGEGPIVALFQQAGALNSDRFILSGNTLYNGSQELGFVTGSENTSFGASETELLITRGNSLYRTTGNDLTTVSFPDNADVSAVTFFSSYFVAIRKATQKWYFSGVSDGNSWAALDFASAENKSDLLLDVLVVDDTLAFLGETSVEFWAPTGNADIPFAPIRGRVFNRGLIAAGCARPFNNTFAWVAPDFVVYTAGNIPNRISTSGIEERISRSTTWGTFTFLFEGHEFFCVRLDDDTVAFDAVTGQWCEFQSYGLNNWRAQCSLDGPVFGDSMSGKLWTFEGYRDDDGVLERRFRGGFPLLGGSLKIDNVRMIVNVGSATELTGDYADPTVEMRVSRDAGRTWGMWRSASMGFRGAYRTRVEWRSCGLADDPGFLAEFRITDPVPFRVSTVQINEVSGGGAR